MLQVPPEFPVDGLDDGTEAVAKLGVPRGLRLELAAHGAERRQMHDVIVMLPSHDLEGCVEGDIEPSEAR